MSDMSFQTKKNQHEASCHPKLREGSEDIHSNTPSQNKKNAFTFTPILQQLFPNSSSTIKNHSSTFGQAS